MNNQITVKNRTIAIGDIVMSIYGRAKLTYIGRQSFTCWTLLDDTKDFIFGRPINIEDNGLDDFITEVL